MRLICPNCGAQYEVPDDVIPDGGRDVQCSNCGDTWFQKHPSQDRELSEELEQSLDEAHWEDAATDTHAQDTAESVAPAGPAPADTAAESDVSEPQVTQWDGFEDGGAGLDATPATTFDPPAEAEPGQREPGHHEPAHRDPGLDDPNVDDPGLDGTGDTTQAPADTEPHAPQPRALDPSVSEILREEAEHEQQARRAETAGGLETQPDLGLEPPATGDPEKERETRLRMARMRGLSEEEALGASAGMAANASRRDLLPDIEEINSSLRKDTDRAAARDSQTETTPARPRRGGFSRGFLTMIVLALLLLVLYAYADRIVAQLPALGGVMEGYVGAVDGLRLWLDQQMLALTGWLDNMAGEP